MQSEQGAADIQITSTTLRVESKIFFLDLKENLRGKYLKISERGSNRERSTIVVPSAGVPWFAALLTYYCAMEGSAVEEGRLIAKQLQVESKAFFFEAGENPRGKYLRVSESGPGTRGRSSLIIPAGGSNCSAWATLRDALSRMNALYLTPPETQGASLPEQVEGSSSTFYQDYPSATASQIDVGGSQQLVGPGPSAPSIGETKAGGQVLRAGHKRFFFDLGSNQKGDFLRITEAVGNDRMSIIVPGAALPQFSMAVQECMSQHEANAAAAAAAPR